MRPNRIIKFVFSVAILFFCANYARSVDLINWKKTVVLEENPASWARMVKLENGSWLAAYAVFGDQDGSRIRVKISSDKMRSWTLLTEFGEADRNPDNANLIQLSTGDILLAMRSLIDKKSYRVQVYKSTNSGRDFKFLSVIDSNENPGNATNFGVWRTPVGDVEF